MNAYVLRAINDMQDRVYEVSINGIANAQSLYADLRDWTYGSSFKFFYYSMAGLHILFLLIPMVRVYSRLPWYLVRYINIIHTCNRVVFMCFVLITVVYTNQIARIVLIIAIMLIVLISKAFLPTRVAGSNYMFIHRDYQCTCGQPFRIFGINSFCRICGITSRTTDDHWYGCVEPVSVLELARTQCQFPICPRCFMHLGLDAEASYLRTQQQRVHALLTRLKSLKLFHEPAICDIIVSLNDFEET